MSERGICGCGRTFSYTWGDPAPMCDECHLHGTPDELKLQNQQQLEKLYMNYDKVVLKNYKSRSIAAAVQNAIDNNINTVVEMLGSIRNIRRFLERLRNQETRIDASKCNTEYHNHGYVTIDHFNGTRIILVNAGMFHRYTNNNTE